LDLWFEIKPSGNPDPKCSYDNSPNKLDKFGGGVDELDPVRGRVDKLVVRPLHTLQELVCLVPPNSPAVTLKQKLR
jgi:hypothetical protein